MALSKPSFLTYLKTLTKPHLQHPPRPLPFLSLRCLSFATPEEAAAERRRRKRRLRIEPPLSSLRHQQPPQAQPRQIPNQNLNPTAPKIPEPVSALAGNRLNLHNRILGLIRANDLDEAALLTRHSIYSNCRPTIFTVNCVLAALLRQSRYSDLLSLHRFITQAGVAANVVTHNLLINAYLDCRRTDTALEHYKQLINDAPFNPSPTTYRILIKGLVDNGKLEQALELKEEMLGKGFAADPVVYSHLMLGHVKNSNADGVFELYEELKEKLDDVDDEVVVGSLMKGYFMRGMEKEAMECYAEAVGGDSKIRMSAVAYNSVLDALSKNGKFDEAMRLFDRMLSEHNPPKRLCVNLGSYNVMVDGFCAEGRFKDAIEVFMKMGDTRCRPDTLSFNNLIEQLCNKGMLAEAEEVYGEMANKGVNPDEFTYVLLMNTCFKENRTDDGAGYFTKMVETGLRPNLAVYSRLVDVLVKVGKVDEAKSFYDLMVKKLKMDEESYMFMMKALFEVGKHDGILEMIGNMLDDDPSEFTTDLQKFVKEELRKEGREEDVVKLMEDKEREKAEARAREAAAAAAAKAGPKISISSLFPSKLSGSKDNENEADVVSGKTIDAISEVKEMEKESSGDSPAVLGPDRVIKSSDSADIDGKSDDSAEQVTV